MLTSSQVLDLSYGDGKFPPYNVEAVFLDEFRMMIYTPEYTEDPPEFILFDTFAPEQDRPANFRRFRLPLKYCRLSPSVNLDAGIGLGTLNQDEPLIVDPTQAFIVLQLSSDDALADVVVALRIQALVEQACLMGTDTCIPWGELEKDAVIVGSSVSYVDPSVQGVHVIQEMEDFDGPDGLPRFCIHTFDFSRRGCSALRDADGETMRAAWREGEQNFPIDSETSGTRFGGVLRPLGNSSFYYPVCGFCRRKVHGG